MAAAEIHTPTLASETIGHIGDFELRNTMLMAWLAIAVLTVFALFVWRTRYREVPGRFQSFAEMIVEGFHNFFLGVVGDERQTRRFFPLVTTIFLFIVVANWMGIFPGVGSIFIEGEHDGHHAMIPLFRSMNADVNMTLGIAILAMIGVQYYGMRELGVGSYLGKFFVAPWKDPIGMFVGILELMGEVSKIISFTFRLFGNIFAGEVLLVVISFLMPYVAPMPFLGMELFVGIVQALVFSMLTLVFLKMGATGHGDHAEEEHPRLAVATA